MYSTTTREVRFPGGGGEQQAWISTPTEPGRYPAIIMFHGRNGVNDPFKEVGVRYAEEGIVGMAVNYFTQTDNPTNVESLQTCAGALEVLRAEPSVDPNRIVMSGYCKGGGLTYLSLGNVPGFAAGVVYHGGLTVQGEKSEGFPEHPAEAALRIDVPFIILHGMSDPGVKIESVFDLARELNRLGKHFELKAYWGTRHAFTLPGNDFVPEHADDAFREAVLFIRRTFGLPVGTVGPLVFQPVGV